MKLAIAGLVVTLSVLTPASVSAQDEMVTHQFVFLRTGPNKVPPDQAQAMQTQHLALLAKLNADRINVVYGPFLDNGDLRGIVVLAVADEAAARKTLADDPFVKGGHMVMDVLPWWGPKGWFHLPQTPPTPEQFVFGFLMRGTNTSMPAEEAKKIQQGHLAYMDELHKQGKLVAAGPFGGTADYRGIVIYRVAGVDEAKQLAAGDPAVKAGRLRIDARPWMTFKGIIK